MVSDEMFSGWGVRTAGRLEMRYASFELTGGYLTVAVCP